MLPREHGAYGQLVLPMLTALAIGRPSLAAAALAVAAVATFISHEPVMVLLGRRGARARRERHREASRALLVSAGGALVFGAIAIARLLPASRWTIAVPAVMAAVAGLSVAGGQERSASGEIVVAAALSSVAFPVAVASSVPTVAALTCAVAFGAGFAAATVSVRAVIAKAHGGGAVARVAAIASGSLILAAVAALSVTGLLMPAVLWAALPVCAVAIAVATVLPPPRYLRQIGWTLVAASALTGIILVIATP